MSKVSVVIPVYNVENYLEKCINSVISQTEKDIDIVLVDDGSTDNSPNICDKFATSDSRINVIHKKNGGPSSARNEGIKAAKSEYIMFLDSDDYFENETIELAYSKACEVNADMVVFPIHSVDESGNVLAEYGVDIDVERVVSLIDYPKLLLINPSPCNKLFRKYLFDNILFPENAWYEDLRIIPQIYPLCKRVVQLKTKALYNYLTRQSTIKNIGNIKKTIASRVDAVNAVMDAYKSNGLFNTYKPELDWIYIFHGYFLPCREIMKFSNERKELMNYLYDNLQTVIDNPYSNKYFNTLSKKEKILFNLYYKKRYRLLSLMLKIKL